MKRIVQIILSVFVISACTQEKPLSDSYRLHESEQRIEIPIADDVYYYSHTMRRFEDTSTGVEYLALLDPRSIPGHSQIVFYRLDSCTEAHRIKIPVQGPNSIADIEGFYAESIDRVFISEIYLPIIYLVNSKGEIIDSYNYEYDDAGRSVRCMSLLSLFDQPLVIKDGCIYGFQPRTYDSFIDSPDGLNFEFSECPIATIIDTVTREVRSSKLCYPELYEKKKGFSNSESVSRIYDGKRFIYSFCLMDELYVTEDHETVKLYPANSRYMEVDKSGNSRSLTMAEGIVEANSKPKYDNIVYDKYRDVYYRFCRMKDTKTPLEGFLNRGYFYCLSDFSIMILNSDLEVIGETMFEAGIYAPKFFFVNEEGLWLSENNYQREDLTDDMLKFRCLKLVENEE